MNREQTKEFEAKLNEKISKSNRTVDTDFDGDFNPEEENNDEGESDGL